MRAGDSDRAAVVDLLRAHHLDGRLTVEEFEERVERAEGAITLLELGDLHEDLPELTPRRGKVVRRSTRAPRVPGLLPFVERVELVADPRTARDEAFQLIAPSLARHGYKLSTAARSSSVRAGGRRGRSSWRSSPFPSGCWRCCTPRTRRSPSRSSPHPAVGRRCSRTASAGFPCGGRSRSCGTNAGACGASAAAR
jgi:hypothetical protein